MHLQKQNSINYIVNGLREMLEDNGWRIKLILYKINSYWKDIRITAPKRISTTFHCIYEQSWERPRLEGETRAEDCLDLI